MSAYGDGFAIKLGLAGAHRTRHVDLTRRPTDHAGLNTHWATAGRAVRTSGRPPDKLVVLGSILLPDAQEKRIKKLVENSREDVRSLKKTIRRSSRFVTAGLGASAVASLALAAALLMNGRKKERR